MAFSFEYFEYGEICKMDNVMEIGRKGEELAATILISRGYIVLQKNYKCKIGEIDIIAVKNRCIHFVEVKTRSSDNYGKPLEAITHHKKKNIRGTAAYYISNCNYDYKDASFDVIGIEISIEEDCF